MQTETLSEWQSARKGKFTASSISKLFTEPKAKADKEAGRLSETALTYIFELAVEEHTGYRKEITVKEMTHGIVNEFEGFEAFVQKSGLQFELTSNQFFGYGANAGASPDGVLFDGIDITAVLDIKCPYSPLSYFNQKMELYGTKMPKSYFYQLQMQMLCTGAKKGYLARYLTNSIVDEYGNKTEYDIPLDERIFWTELNADEEVHQQIIDKVKAAEAIKQGFIQSFKK
jgi:hypothetical protein